jgi:hypothetical protein
MAVLLGAVSLLLSTTALPVYAQQQTITSPYWTVDVSYGSLNVTAGQRFPITMTVHIVHTVYDMQISAFGNNLKFDNNQGGGSTISLGQISGGNVRQDVELYVTVPPNAPTGNVYNVTIQAQSYNSPAGPFGLRSPLDGPTVQGMSMLLRVVPTPPVVVGGGGGGGGIPEYSFGLLATSVFTILLVGAYLVARRR